MYRIVESLYCTPETNITLYVNYTGIKKGEEGEGREGEGWGCDEKHDNLREEVLLAKKSSH